MAEQTSIGANDGTIATPVGATPSTGPFAVDFPFDNLDDVAVISTDALGNATVLARGIDYVLSATVNGDGLYPSGIVVLIVARANVTIARVRRTPLERTSQLPLTGYLDRAALNSDLNRMMMAMQDFDRRYGQFIRLPDSDPVVDAVVPDKASRAGKTFIWDADGEPAAGDVTTSSLVLNDFWQLTMLPTAAAPAARAALGAAALASSNSFTATNSFTALTSFTAGATFTSLSPTAPAPPALDDSTKVPNTAWVQDAMDAKLSGVGALATVPVIVELTAGSGTWAVPAGTKWLDVEMVGGGGGGGAASITANGAATVFDGISVGGGLSGGIGFGGLGGSGGTGSGTATKIVRRSGAPGENGSPPAVITLVGDVPATWRAFGGNGGEGLLGGAAGLGSLTAAGTAGAANSGAGGGGYGIADGTPGGGGGGAGEYALLRYATLAASYSYTVGAGATGSGLTSSGGSGYIRIRCHFNY